MAIPVRVAVEGPTDEAIALRLLALSGLDAGPVYGKGGKPLLDARIASWNRSAIRLPWLVLRDLDHDADCAPALIAKLLGRSAPQMCFRVAVREAEAWLLGDRERAARWLAVARDLIPRDPEQDDDPKRTSVDLARRSRSADVRRDMVPPPGSTAAVGRGYLAQIQLFAQAPWRPEVAAKRCPSLQRCLHALRRLASAG